MDQEKPHNLETDENIDSKWPLKGAIELKNYTARYRKELPIVVNDITVSIPAGTKVGICGRTGAGKSSLTGNRDLRTDQLSLNDDNDVRLFRIKVALFRLIEGDSGKIVIDGLDISKIGLNKLRIGDIENNSVRRRLINRMMELERIESYAFTPKKDRVCQSSLRSLFCSRVL